MIPAVITSLANARKFIKPARAISRVFLHCSASDAAGASYEGAGLVKTIDHMHRTRPESQGGPFREIGYHYVIDKRGQVMTTSRTLEETPAAQAPHNPGTIAICCHGLDVRLFTPAQLMACLELCQAIDAAYNGRVTFHGHREVANKTCPVFDYVRLLDLDKFGRMLSNPLRN